MVLALACLRRSPEYLCLDPLLLSRVPAGANAAQVDKEPLGWEDENGKWIAVVPEIETCSGAMSLPTRVSRASDHLQG